MILFFGVMELLLAFIFYHYRNIEEEHLKERIFLEMKNYALFFKGNEFDVDIAPVTPTTRFFELLEDNDSLYLLVPFPDAKNRREALKVYYPKSHYEKQVETLRKTILWQFLPVSGIAFFIAILFSWYVLRPLRLALSTLERFMKDLLHDLNTPLTSIRINLTMMERNEETESIAKSAHTLAMLQRNLDAYLKERIGERERFRLRDLVEEQVRFFADMYDRFEWRIDIDSDTVLYTDKNAFSRIIYNLLSNACKYNIADGYIHIRFTDRKRLLIENSSMGIRHPERVFDRFYKEHDRGLGIGLHIVKNLGETLGIAIRLDTTDSYVRFLLDLRQVTQN